MIKIKVSYERPDELSWLLAKLWPEAKNCRKSKNQEGKFRKAYIEIKTE